MSDRGARSGEIDRVLDDARRSAVRARLGAEQFDVLVIGGGITGAGVALDAATRGLRTAIIDKGDWASGTSSKSSKLVHGGLRYLQQKEYRLVYENLRERQRLLQNAPHLVHVMPFLIPLFGKGGVVSATVAKGYSTALWLYDLTGGWRIGKRHQRLTVAEAGAHMRGLAPERLVAGFLYFDAQADDARLTLTLVRSAVDHGAVALNYAAAIALIRDPSGKVGGAMLIDGTEVRAQCVVNAGGVWAEEIGAMGGPVDFRIRPAKGIHITVPFEKVGADIAAVVPVRKDKRSVFVVPAFDDPGLGAGTPERVYIGTTDTDYTGPLDNPTCTPGDVRYLLDAMNDWLEVPLTEDDVLATWAGLRPLLSDAKSEKTADLSRRHSVQRSANGVVSILGGKLTTYREMAEDTVDEVLRSLGKRSRCRTARLPLHGAPRVVGKARRSTTLASTDHLYSRHGTDADLVAGLVREDPALGRALVPGLAYLQAEAVHAVRHEYAVTLEDVLCRRTRAALLDASASATAAPAVARILAAELGWSAEHERDQVARFQALFSVDSESRRSDHRESNHRGSDPRESDHAVE